MFEKSNGDLPIPIQPRISTKGIKAMLARNPQGKFLVCKIQE